MCQRRAVKGEVGDKPLSWGSLPAGAWRRQAAVFTAPKSHSNGRQSRERPSQGQAWQPTQTGAGDRCQVPWALSLAVAQKGCDETWGGEGSEAPSARASIEQLPCPGPRETPVSLEASEGQALFPVKSAAL